MRLGVLLVLVLAIVAIWCIYVHSRNQEEHFFAGDSVQVSWTPSGPNPQNIAYNWGVCISKGASSPVGQCSAQTPAYPPGPPSSSWNYHGQTPRGQSSLTLSNSNCFACGNGQVLTLLLQAVDVAVPSNPASSWAAFTIDLTSKATVVKNSITDSISPTEPVYPGSSGFIYTLQLNQPAFAQGNTTKIIVQVLRGSTVFSYTTSVPFTNISTDSTTGTYTGSFTTSSSSSPWNQAPGILQTGDQVTVYSEVFSPGNSQNNGEVFFAGSVQQTATAITPSTPAGVVWNLA